MWWFFTLIMVSSYTANLAAFLTIENPLPLIEKVEDLIENKNNLQFGTKKDGATKNFFKGIEGIDDDSYKKKLFAVMNDTKNKDWFVEGNEEGLEKAKKGRYVYFAESSVIEYYIERHCEVTQVGGTLDEKGYGIAMKKGKKNFYL
jgi:glutamate receptor, ionotropic, invertebrate